MATIFGSSSSPKHNLVTYRQTPSGWQRGASAQTNSRLTPEHVGNALASVDRAISTLGPIGQHNDKRIWEIDSEIPEQDKDTLSFVSEMSRHWLPAMVKNGANVEDPRFLHLVGQIVSGIHDKELSQGADVGEDYLNLPLGNPNNVDFLRHAMYPIQSKKPNQKNIGQPAWKPWTNLAGLVGRLDNFFEPNLMIDDPRDSPFAGYEYLRKDPYHKIGSDFMNLLTTYAQGVRKNPHIADVVDHFGERNMGIGEMSSDTSAKQLANYLLSFSAQTDAASTNPGMAKGVKMIKSKLTEIARLLYYDKDRALIEIRKFVKNEPPSEKHKDFTKSEIGELKDVLGWAYLIKKNLMMPDMFMKAWSMETTPWDINALPPKKYNHTKKTGQQYEQGTHQHSIIETFVRKDPDSSFIDTMLLRLALDRYVEEKNE